MNKKTLKSLGAVLAGFVAVVVLSLGTDLVLHATGVFPAWGQPMSDALFLLATVYRTIYCIAGSYIAARFAPDKPMKHALVLGVVGLIISTAGAVATWNKGPEFGPHWYPAALIVTAIPCAWLGGKLRVMQLPARIDG
jgi:surface polysaccharide O-acyltransferase-like enzyme